MGTRREKAKRVLLLTQKSHSSWCLCITWRLCNPCFREKKGASAFFGIQHRQETLNRNLNVVCQSVTEKKKQKKKQEKKKRKKPADTLRIEIRLVWLFNLIGGWRFALPFFLFFHCHSQAFVWASSSWVTESKVVREPLIFLFYKKNITLPIRSS